MYVHVQVYVHAIYSSCTYTNLTSDYISVLSKSSKLNEWSPDVPNSHCTIQQMRTTTNNTNTN